MTFNSVFKEAALLVVFSILLSVLVNAISPKGIPWKGQWDLSQGVVRAKPTMPEEAGAAKTEIQLEEAIEKYEAGKLFLDARSTGEYTEGHIKGAVSLSVENFWEQIGDFQSQYPQNTPVVCYCNGLECTDSHDLAENLRGLGYTEVVVFTDGFPVWEGEGLPVERE